MADHPEARGRGPKKGAPNAGRPPDKFKEMCRELASSAEVEQAARRVLKDPLHPAWKGALTWASEHGYGKPAQTVEIGGSEGFAALVAASMKITKESP